MADYSDIGFDQFLQRTNPPQTTVSATPQLNPQTSDYLTQSYSASRINGGVLSSNDGKFVVDLNNGILQISNGASNLVTLGTLSDGSIGLQLKDNSGNTILQISNTSVILSSSNGKMQLDFNAETLQVFDDSGTPVVLLGKLS